MLSTLKRILAATPPPVDAINTQIDVELAEAPVVDAGAAVAVDAAIDVGM